MKFPRQGYWSELSLPSPKDLPHPGIEPRAPTLGGGFFTAEPKCLLNRSVIVGYGENNRNKWSKTGFADLSFLWSILFVSYIRLCLLQNHEISYLCFLKCFTFLPFTARFIHFYKRFEVRIKIPLPPPLRLSSWLSPIYWKDCHLLFPPVNIYGTVVVK